MKTITAITLCAVLVVAPLNNTDAVPTGAPPADSDLYWIPVCVIGAAVVAGAVVTWMMKSCKPKYYCVQDSDGNTFPSNATKTERAVNEWKVKSGPYASVEEATAVCPPKTNSLSAFVAIASMSETTALEDEVLIPSEPISIWKSTNLVHWVKVASLMDDPYSFSWSETNALDSHAFYRVATP